MRRPANRRGLSPPPEFDEAYFAELKAKVGERLADALDTKTHDKLESQNLVKQIKDELAAGLPADDPAAKKKLAHYYEHLRERIFPRAGHQGSDQTRSSRVRRDSRPSRSNIRFCRARTVRHFLLAVRRRHWSRPPWALPTTDSASRPMRASSGRTSCCITISHRSAWVRRAAWAARDGVKSAMEHWRSAPLQRFCPARKSRLTASALFPTFLSRTDLRQWRRFAAQAWRCMTPASSSRDRWRGWPWAW